MGRDGGRIIEDERIENERLCEGIGQPRSLKAKFRRGLEGGEGTDCC